MLAYGQESNVVKFPSGWNLFWKSDGSKIFVLISCVKFAQSAVWKLVRSDIRVASFHLELVLKQLAPDWPVCIKAVHQGPNVRFHRSHSCERKQQSPTWLLCSKFRSSDLLTRQLKLRCKVYFGFQFVAFNSARIRLLVSRKCKACEFLLTPSAAGCNTGFSQCVCVFVQVLMSQTADVNGCKIRCRKAQWTLLLKIYSLPKCKQVALKH